MKWSLQQIAQWTNGEVLSAFQQDFSDLGTDTREDLSGQIFIALKGDQFDAHAYLDKAVEKGAKALLVHSLPEKFLSLKNKVSIILVKDTLKALQDFAREYRSSLKVQVIGITGSNGKTTTKEFTAQIIGPYRKVFFSKGSFNNHWGVPLTLLKMPIETEIAVVEMGMNHANEISELVKIAIPNIVVCTVVGTAHIEFFGTQAKIAEAKSEIYLDSMPETVRIFNQDQNWTFDMMYPAAKKFPDARMLSFSEKNNTADVFFKIEQLTMKSLTISGFIAGKEGKATIPVFGKQNLTNILAAATLAYACRLSPEQIWHSLSNCKTTWGRNQFIATQCGAEILFDGYNANPDSMLALLENIPILKSFGDKIGVFGQMKELGSEAARAHQSLGKKVAECGFKQVYFIGENHFDFAKGLAEGGYNQTQFIFEKFDTEIGKTLSKSIKSGDFIVVKGSRGAETERFVDYCQPINWSSKK